jgi:ArsR family transcriptional regulator
MAVDLELMPKTKRAPGAPCCEPVVYPDVERDVAVRVAAVAKAFDLSQPTISHHLKVLRDAGIVGSERQGLWAYYFVIPDALRELSGWLS